MSPEPSDAALRRLLDDARWLQALARELAGGAAEDLLQDAWLVALERPPLHARLEPIAVGFRWGKCARAPGRASLS